MKNTILTMVAVIITSLSFSQPGSSFATAIPLQNGCNTYSFTNTLAASQSNCASQLPPVSAPYAGVGRTITFVLTTQPGDPVPCINVHASLSTAAVLEVVVYRLDQSTGGDLYYHTVCFNDGNGYWAPQYDGTYGGGEMQESTTYYLRYRVQANTDPQLTICASVDAPVNQTCASATTITTTPTWYHNSCHNEDVIPPGDVCATTLENTAWFTYTTTGTNEDMLNVSAINCDNFESDYAGYQLGIFIGGCGSLQSYGPCFADLGGSLQFPLTGLPAGTQVHVAFDGRASSNCRAILWVGLQPTLSIDTTQIVRPPKKKKVNIRYNNPVDDYLYLFIDSKYSQLAKIEVINMAGQVMVSKREPLHRGMNGMQYTFYGYAAGLYIVRVTLEEEQHQIKIFSR